MLRKHIGPLLTSLLLPFVAANGHSNEQVAASADSSSSSMSSSSSSVQASQASQSSQASADDQLHHDMHEDTLTRLHPEHTEYQGNFLPSKHILKSFYLSM